jgi:hypothetical protein
LRGQQREMIKWKKDVTFTDKEARPFLMRVEVA